MKKTIASTLIAGSVLFGGIMYFGAGETPSTYLQVKLGNGSGYEDGDIVVAHNADETLFIQAEQVTHPSKMTRKPNGNVESNSTMEDFYEDAYQYKFERISPTEVRRTKRFNDIATETGVVYQTVNEIDIISNIPNAKGEFIDIDEFIQKNRLIIFGETGSEYWYGGVIKTDNATVNKVWDKIEAKTTEKRDSNWKFSDQEKKSFALVKVQDMTNDEVKELMKPLTDVDGNIIKKRAYKVDTSKLGLTVKETLDLNDKTKLHDFRDKNLDINVIKVQKVAPVAGVDLSKKDK